MTDRKEERAPSDRVLAWDLPTRVFKWTFAALIVDAWLSNKYGSATPVWHKWNGYAVLVAVVFRLLWGVFGGSTARFSQFVRPGAVLAYLRGLLHARESSYLGHNPPGGLWIVTILAVVCIVATLGLFSADEERHVIVGPLSGLLSRDVVDTVTGWHVFGFNVILALVGLHLAAVALYDIVKRARLVPAMVRGTKPAAPYVDCAEARPGSLRAAAACLAAAVVLVFGAIVAMGGDPVS